MSEKKVLTTEEFAEKVKQIAEEAGPFTPGVIYIPEGDCIEALFKSHPFRGVEVDDRLTIYYSQETNEIVGCFIDRVSKLVKQEVKNVKTVSRSTNLQN